MAVESPVPVGSGFEEGGVPLCRCRVLYIGSAVPTVTKDGLQGIQQPLHRRYPVEQSPDTRGIDSWISVWSNGVLLEYIEGERRSETAFFPIQTLHYCAAVRYVNVTGYAVEGGGERFLPLDSPFANIPESPHPPIFAAIMRRTSGVKVLECHGFICTNNKAANALVRCCFHAYADSVYLSMEDKLPGVKGAPAIKDAIASEAEQRQLSLPGSPRSDASGEATEEGDLTREDRRDWSHRQQGGEYDTASISSSMLRGGGGGNTLITTNSRRPKRGTASENDTPSVRGGALLPFFDQRSPRMRMVGSDFDLSCMDPDDIDHDLRARARHLPPHLLPSPLGPMRAPPHFFPPPPHLLPPHMRNGGSPQQVPLPGMMFFRGPPPQHILRGRLPPPGTHTLPPGARGAPPPGFFMPPPPGAFMMPPHGRMPPPPFFPFRHAQSPEGGEGPIITGPESVYGTMPRGRPTSFEEPIVSGMFGPPDASYAPGNYAPEQYDAYYDACRRPRPATASSTMRTKMDDSFSSSRRDSSSVWDNYEAGIYRRAHLNEKAFSTTLRSADGRDTLRGAMRPEETDVPERAEYGRVPEQSPAGRRRHYDSPYGSVQRNGDSEAQTIETDVIRPETPPADYDSVDGLRVQKQPRNGTPRLNGGSTRPPQPTAAY